MQHCKQTDPSAAELLNLVYGDSEANQQPVWSPNSEKPPTWVSVADVRAAQQRLQGHIRPTPLTQSFAFDDMVSVSLGSSAQIFFKCEQFQRIGAFKFRGAFNAIAALDERRREGGIITYSSGNHAQAIALAGRLHNAPTTIIMPNDAPRIKYESTLAHLDPESDSEIIQYDPQVTTREALGEKIARERHLTLIKPFDNPFVIAGQGTAALELVEQLRNGADPHDSLDIIFVPCGGGGLLSGTSVAIRACFPNCQIVGVEPEAGNDAFLSFRDLVLQTVHNPQTWADGARTPSLGAWTFPIVCKNVDTMVTISDDELREATKYAYTTLKLAIEPTAALGLAAIIKSAGLFDQPFEQGLSLAGCPIELRSKKRVATILTGGNADLQSLASWIAH